MKRELYWDESTGIYQDVPQRPYPTELELLQIFPEAKEIIPQKISERLRFKGRYLAKKVIPFIKLVDGLQKAGKINSFDRWFWVEAMKAVIDERFVDCVENIERLKRLQLLAGNKRFQKRTIDFARAKEVAKQIPILELYHFQRVKQNRQKVTALCPFHKEDTPSFVIYPNNSFHCFGCGASGDSIDFMKSLRGCSFSEAVTQLAGGVSCSN